VKISINPFTIKNIWPEAYILNNESGKIGGN
jgi:hypothetical protein